ncbi:MAG TPA: PQQ-binding-like beta-propeller repeat protein [Rhizomicrobium sp.]|nr:PQQ-binding-like beta-propeller repeat protein [Rhizomicrobium sp.]
MGNKTLLLAGAAFCVAAAIGTVAFAQGQPGPFTQGQVETGRQAFADNCALCHRADMAGTNDAPALTGTAFMGAWKGRTTDALYSKIAKTMPASNPGDLDEATYTAITAYILRANGATPGASAFTPSSSVAIGSIANGQMPADLNTARVAQGGAQAAGGARVPPRRPDPGRFSLPTKFGLMLKGNIQNYVPVTDEMLRNPPDGDWLMFRRTYAGWSYSPLNQINTSNVSQLQLKWMWSMPENGTMEITPMVHNGIIYVWGTGNTIQALDAKTGNLLWENRIGPAPRNPGPGPSTEETRALGLWGNYLFVNTPYGMLYGLDARTGEKIWETNIVDYKPGIGGSTGGVIVINGKVLVGMTNCGRPGNDDHCYISAYDAKTGKRDWKFVTVALKGDPGGDSWGSLPDNQRKGAETWIAGTYDPELNTTYWGVAQAKPWRRDLRGSSSGDTNYANSTLALDPDTGKMKWWFQHGPGESLDLDEVYERVLINHGDQKTLMTIGKAGILWKLDRVTGKFIAAKETVFQNIWKSIDPKTGRPEYRKDIVDQKVDQWLSSCPGPEGGHDWQATSYHQPSDTLIIPLSQSCVFMLGNGSQAYFEMPGSDGNMGRLSAYRTADMKPLWSFQQRAPFLTGVISTAGNVAFVGDFDRVFRAVDVRNGQTLWKTRLGTTVQGFPVSFSVDGKQYVAVTTGLGGGSPEAKPGTMLSEVHRPPNGYALFVFGLPDDK